MNNVRLHPESLFYDAGYGGHERESTYRLNQVAIRMIEMPPLYSDEPMRNPSAAVKVMADTLKHFDREVVAVVNLAADLKPINMNIVSMGALDMSVAHPREILKSTILSNAASIMLVHNHPSNSLSPSTHDIALTDRIKRISDLIGINFLDHIIVGPGNEFYSFKEKEVMPLSTLKYASDIEDIRLEGINVAEKNTDFGRNTEEKKTVTFTVTECSEFHDMGEYHEDIKNIKEALEKFNAIPEERMHGVKAVGIKVADEKNPDDSIQMDILVGNRIDIDMLQYVPEIAENNRAKQMIAELIHAMPDAEIMGKVPEDIEKRIGWIEGREKREGEMQKITDQLEKGVSDVFKGDNYRQYLDTMAKFPKYSVNNSLLIMMQKPQASLCQSFTGWKKMGRYVKKGEKGINILAPSPYKIERENPKLDKNGKQVFDSEGEPVMVKEEITIKAFRAVKTFDISQTDGKELPSLGPSELAGSIEGYPKLLQALKDTSPVPVSFEMMKGSAKGCYRQEDKKIVVKDGMSDVQTVKTLIHEMAHQKLHDKDGVPEASDMTRSKKEVEAESVAYVVCQHYGINTSDYSFSYVASWSDGKETKELKASLDKIRQTASEFINSIDERLEAITADKEQAEEASKPEKNTEEVKDTMTKGRKPEEKRASIKKKIRDGAGKAGRQPATEKKAAKKHEQMK